MIKCDISLKNILIRRFTKLDISIAVDAFQKVDWQKSASTFEGYLEKQFAGKRIVWVAYSNEQFAGYVTLKWESSYPYFADNFIPEIMDLNVLPDFRNEGIGSKLLDTAELLAATKTTIIGIGVGLYGDYGPAQRLYVKRGYIPDGNGVTYRYQFLAPGSEVSLDDDLVLWFTKKL